MKINDSCTNILISNYNNLTNSYKKNSSKETCPHTVGRIFGVSNCLHGEKFVIPKQKILILISYCIRILLDRWRFEWKTGLEEWPWNFWNFRHSIPSNMEFSGWLDVIFLSPLNIKFCLIVYFFTPKIPQSMDPMSVQSPWMRKPWLGYRPAPGLCPNRPSMDLAHDPKEL